MIKLQIIKFLQHHIYKLTPSLGLTYFGEYIRRYVYRCEDSN